jgi:L-asparagine transporter-like permease
MNVKQTLHIGNFVLHLHLTNSHMNLLLPHRARIIGTAFTLAAAVIFLLLILSSILFPETFDEENNWLKMLTVKIFFITLISGLIILALSKEKNEDEMHTKIRMEALVQALVFGGTYTIFTIILGIFYQEYSEFLEAPFIIIFQLAMFHAFFADKKRKLKDLNDDQL